MAAYSLSRLSTTSNLRLIRTEVLQRDIAFARLVIGELQVTLGECAARYVFAGQANGRAFEHEAAESKCFGKAPIDRRPLQDLSPLLDQRLSAWDED